MVTREGKPHSLTTQTKVQDLFIYHRQRNSSILSKQIFFRTLKEKKKKYGLTEIIVMVEMRHRH